MHESWAEIIENNLKKVLPLLFSTFLLLIAYIPVHIPLSQFFRPDIGMICVYFWTLYRQDLFGVCSTLVFAVIADSLSAAPDGLNIFIFIFIFTMSVTFASYVNTKPFAVNWAGFSVISLMAFVVKWLLSSMFYSRFLPFGGIFAAYAATVFLYPLIARLNIYIQNRFLAGEEVIYEQR